MPREDLIHRIAAHNPHDLTERAFIPRFRELLEHPRAFQRTHLPGHITGSAWIVDEDFDSCLLVHHARIDRWLQPGGHADGDEDVMHVAMREVHEETGLNLQPGLNVIFDVDIHAIPATHDFPSHDHYDIRFLFTARKDARLSCSAESKDVRWFSLSDVPSVTNRNLSIMRMIEKVKEYGR